MAKTVRDVMNPDPVALGADQPVMEAARVMSERHIGSVVVMDQNKPCGIVTDRDITVRAVAKGADTKSLKLSDICSKSLATVRPDQSVEDAINLMKSKDVKRIVVMSDSRLEGIVSLGDLTAQGQAGDVQQDLSRSRPNG